MKIEKLEPAKRRQGQFLLFLEGEDEPLCITEEEVLRFGLHAGLDLGAERAAELRRSAARSSARTRAADMIATRPLSRRELVKRLCERGADEADAAAAADWLESIGALDDLSYARMLVRRYSAEGYGEAKLRDELYRRGVPRELWDEALAAAPPAEETIARVIAAKTKGAPPDERARRRLADLLRRRGFAWRDIRPALSALGEELEEE